MVYSQPASYDNDFENKYKDVDVESEKTILKDATNPNNKIVIKEENVKVYKNGSIESEYKVTEGTPGTAVDPITRPTTGSSFTSTDENDKWLNSLISKLHSVIMRKGIFSSTQEKDIFKNDKDKFGNNLWNILSYRIELLFQNLK